MNSMQSLAQWIADEQPRRFLLRWSFATWAALSWLLPFGCGLVLAFQLFGFAPLRSILPAPYEAPAIVEHWLLTPLFLTLSGAFYGVALGQMQRSVLHDYFGWQPPRWRRWTALGGALGALAAHLLILGLGTLGLYGWNLIALPVFFAGIGWGQERSARLDHRWIGANVGGGLVCAALFLLAQFTGILGLLLITLAPAAPAFVSGPALLRIFEDGDQRPKNEESSALASASEKR